MMRHASSLCTIAMIFAAAPALADQQVTLKSGATLVGMVKVDGDAIVVTIDDSDLRVPLAEVDTIESVDSSPARQAHRLLLTALEARLMNDAGKEVIGLLAEAQRLAPEDPHIAFWYASSLSDAGFGQAARDILEKRREAIAKAYPGMADQLAEQIKRRVEMEKMPPALVERLDKMNSEAGSQPENNEMRRVATVFRVIDQNDRPIERSAFQIQCNGQDENLETFDDGFYIHTFNRHRNNQEEPCHLFIVRPGLEGKEFMFTGATNRVHDAGEFVVQRYDEDAKVPFRLHVVDVSKQPIAGVRISLQATSPRGGSSSTPYSAESDADGRVEILAFPMKYSYSVQADGFNHSDGSVELKTGDADAKEREHQLHRAIRATIRLAWDATMMQGGGKQSGEATLEVDGGPPGYRHGQEQTQWIQPAQVQDRLNLQFTPTNFGYGPYGPPETWLRVVEKEAAEGDEAAVESADPKARLIEFQEIDLADIDDLKEKLSAPRTVANNQPGNPNAPKVVTTEAGRIYVGRLQHRDMRTGQPLQLAFKVFVEEMTTDSE